MQRPRRSSPAYARRALAVQIERFNRVRSSLSFSRLFRGARAQTHTGEARQLAQLPVRLNKPMIASENGRTTAAAAAAASSSLPDGASCDARAQERVRRFHLRRTGGDWRLFIRCVARENLHEGVLELPAAAADAGYVCGARWAFYLLLRAVCF